MHVIRPNGRFSFCGACFFLHETLDIEKCESVTTLHAKMSEREFTRARVNDLLRRTGVEDAEQLIRQLER